VFCEIEFAPVLYCSALKMQRHFVAPFIFEGVSSAGHQQAGVLAEVSFKTRANFS
jgi:hypothetical protein